MPDKVKFIKMDKIPTIFHQILVYILVRDPETKDLWALIGVLSDDRDTMLELVKNSLPQKQQYLPSEMHKPASQWVLPVSKQCAIGTIPNWDQNSCVMVLKDEILVITPDPNFSKDLHKVLQEWKHNLD